MCDREKHLINCPGLMYVACFVNLATKLFQKKKSLIQYLVRLSVLLRHNFYTVC